MSRAITFRRATCQPVTVEREVRVVTELGVEGYAGVSWESGHPRLYGPVYTLERHFDGQGNERRAPTKTILCAEPIFA